MSIVKSGGVTRTEQLLAHLCDRTFLKLWSYPNPIKEDGDELCDLLAIFDNHVFIFFDRENQQLDNPDKDPRVSWGRWKRKVIDAQMRTADGAERYIRSGRGIFLDTDLNVPFPISFDVNSIIIHKIIVAHGAKEACETFSDDNVYGSLAISYGPSDTKFQFPFMIDINKKNPVHIFDTHNLEIILAELDTFYDFTSYLNAKLEAIERYDCLLYCGEEDLLAHYYLNYDETEKRHFIGTKQEGINSVAVGEGEWKDFVEQDIYKTKKIADQSSYLWDELIQRTCQNALDGTLLGNANLLRGPSALHEMAKEPRFMRRALSDKMLQAIRDFPKSSQPIVRNLTFMPSFYEGKAYVFLQLKVERIDDYENEYRPRRQALLQIACGAAKNKFRHLTTIIGIAIDAPKFARENSEDFLLMDCADWPDDRQVQFEQANEGLKFFSSDTLVSSEEVVTEFPPIGKNSPRRLKAGKTGRNDSCPCGSGKKYKKCCIDGGPASKV